MTEGTELKRTSGVRAVLTSLVRAGSGVAFVGAVWLLPPGNVLWVGALLAVVGPAMVGKLVGAKELVKPGVGQPGGAFFGMAAVLVPLPVSGLPYREEVLLPLIAAGVVGAHVFLGVQLAMAGWRVGRAGVVAGVSSVVAIGAGVVGMLV